MANSFFQFKKFTIHQDLCAMKVTTDGCLFGAWTAKEIEESYSNKNVLDIGAGTGLLSLMIAQKNASSHIDAVEIQENDFQQCIQNVQESIFHQNIKVYNSAIQSFVPKSKYDIIVSNPPFYQNHLTGSNHSKNTAHHQATLDFATLVTYIKTNLQHDGHFYLLVPFVQLSLIENELQKTQLNIYKKCFIKQTPKHNYFRVFLQGGNLNQQQLISEIIIKENNNYTTAFIELLQAYYLHL